MYRKRTDPGLHKLTPPFLTFLFPVDINSSNLFLLNTSRMHHLGLQENNVVYGQRMLPWSVLFQSETLTQKERLSANKSIPFSLTTLCQLKHAQVKRAGTILGVTNNQSLVCTILAQSCTLITVQPQLGFTVGFPLSHFSLCCFLQFTNQHTPSGPAVVSLLDQPNSFTAQT